MRHVLWIDKNTIEKYRSSYTPVSHPLFLSGRSPPSLSSSSSSSSSSSHLTDRDNEDSKQRGEGDKGNTNITQHTYTQMHTQKDSLPTSSKRSLEVSHCIGIDKDKDKEKEKEKDSRMTTSAIDDVKMRFLARKKAKSVGSM